MRSNFAISRQNFKTDYQTHYMQSSVTLRTKSALLKPVSFRISKKLKVQPKVGGLWEEWASALNINAWSAKLAGQPK